MLIVIWTPLSILSQNIVITPSQQKRIDSIFTAERIIDISKGLSNEKVQDSVIKVRDIQISELENKIELLKSEYTKTLVEIAKQNAIAKGSSSKIGSITDSEKRSNSFKWFNFHLYGNVEVPRFEFQRTSVSLELMYQINKIEVGIMPELAPNHKDGDYSLNYQLKVRYKFF